MDCSTPGLPVHHQLPEFTQNQVHWVGDAIQPSHPLSSSSSAFNPSQHQGNFHTSQLFPSGGQSIGGSASASVLPMNIQDWFPLGWTGWISLLTKGLSKSLLQRHSSKASYLVTSVYFHSRPPISLYTDACVHTQSLSHVWLLWSHGLYSLPGSSARSIFQARILE